MLSTTLTSFAMLKIKVDEGGDYLEYLTPFVLQVLVKHSPEPATEEKVKNYILQDYGLEIPERTIQIVLGRVARKHRLKKKDRKYYITNTLQNPGIDREKAAAERHIFAVANGLIDFSKDNKHPIKDQDDAIKAICAFLREFEIPCIRTYLRGTAIPEVGAEDNTRITLVCQYVTEIQLRKPERFESFMVLVIGHMLANALLCPDISDSPKTYKKVSFYFDTPLIIHLLGLEGEERKNAAEELVSLIKKLDGRIKVFSHTLSEIQGVILGAANYLNELDEKKVSNIAMEARRNGTTKSDLIIFAETLENSIEDVGIEIQRTPLHEEKFQISEVDFENILKLRVKHQNPKALKYDIDSVRSIYSLRSGVSFSRLEDCSAVLVSSNVAFAKAAFEYGIKHENPNEKVSSVITDYSLANISWLKSPMKSPSVPISEVLAFSYAAQRPSMDFFEKFLDEVEKRQKQGKINSDEHVLLRSSPYVQDALMSITLGSEDSLNEGTVDEVLQRVTKESREGLIEERKAHQNTRSELNRERSDRSNIEQSMYLDCVNKSRHAANFIILFILSFYILSACIPYVTPSFPYKGVSFGVLTLVEALTILGFALKDFHGYLKRQVLSWLILQRQRTYGIDLTKGASTED